MMATVASNDAGVGITRSAGLRRPVEGLRLAGYAGGAGRRHDGPDQPLGNHGGFAGPHMGGVLKHISQRRLPVYLNAPGCRAAARTTVSAPAPRPGARLTPWLRAGAS
jgi:hypothetical protein